MLTKSILRTISLLLILIFCLQKKVAAQEQQTFYITNTTYEAFQVDKVPFAMRKISIVPSDESITIADKIFYKTSLKDGSVLYLTTDRKGYLLAIEKKEQVGFFVCPNGK